MARFEARSVRRTIRLAELMAIATFVVACGNNSAAPPPPATPTPVPTPDVSSRAPAPWGRTEERESCSAYSVTRSPHFGDLHVHTTYSADAVTFNVLGTPTDAYEFARGNEIRLAPYDADGRGTRPLRLRRPLDFAAVTDHSEGFGAYHVCFTPGEAGYDSEECKQVRGAAVSADPAQIQYVFLNVLVPVVVNPEPKYPPGLCGDPPTRCQEGAAIVWSEIGDVAERFYDRSSSCGFTTFKGYEYTANPSQPGLATGANLHRNVIFRNAEVPAQPVTYVDQPKPQGMWRKLRETCQGEVEGCDWIAIPHNSNLSGGFMFATENADGSSMTLPDARERAAMEPVMEIYQHKGSSECRTGAGTTDEECGYELANRVAIYDGSRNLDIPYPAGNFVRTALGIGLQKEGELGANPFEVGFIASTDTHNAIPGATVEKDYEGHSGLNDDTNERRLFLGGLQRCPANADPNDVRCGRSRADDGPGGLAVVWAEENSRDALFAAMRRRETYGTSGTRPILRFFAGDYAAGVCDGDVAAAGYRSGVPMGSELGPFRGASSPTFAVLALRDPGEPAAVVDGVERPAIAGTPLHKVEIVKGWVDAAGEVHEEVFHVAGDEGAAPAVDMATCEPAAEGHDRLCATWTDPGFDPSQRAYYYARLFENPVCRWTELQCRELGVDCSDPAKVPPRLVACCDETVARTVEKRAWASPIWFKPDGLGAVRGEIRFGEGAESVSLDVPMGAGAVHDLAASALTVALRDSTTIWEATLPAGSFVDGRYEDPSGARGGVTSARFERADDGSSRLVVEATSPSLPANERLEHVVEVAVRIGDWSASQARLWTASEGRLGTAG